MEQTIKDTLEEFLKSGDFRSGVINSTKAGWCGSSYSVELFKDGTWRVLWDNEIGNRYESPGEIISIPAFDDDEYQDLVINGDMSEGEFFDLCFFHQEEDLMKTVRKSLQ